MKRSLAKSFLLTIVSLSAVAVVANAGQVRQFAAQFLNFDGTEQSTKLDASSGGQPIYQGKVFVPADTNILEITISATGDLLNGGTPVSNSLWLNCQVDGQPCNAGLNSAGNSVPGWVPVLSLQAGAQIAEASTSPATATDNNIHYSWCMPIKPKKTGAHLWHDVQLSMASGDGNDTVQVEQIHVFVGGVTLGGRNHMNACTVAAVPTPVP